jgi:formamidopyrimidine-DNA glycosylase
VPELPEVETIVRGLAASIVGKNIASVEIRLGRIVFPEPVLFAQLVAGRRIVACTRRAKYIVLLLEDGQRIVVHLRMTGRLIYAVDRPLETPKYAHVEIRFEDGSTLFFADTRTFGRMRVVAPGEDWDAELGVEPLSDDFTLSCFTGILTGRATPIKAFLLDQRRIAGIGNI